jgi:hypothetical protein
VVQGTPEIRVGQRIHFVDTDMEAYVESITESASLTPVDNPQAYLMTIQFSRGMTPTVKQQVAEDWQAMQQFLPKLQSLALSPGGP